MTRKLACIPVALSALLASGCPKDEPSWPSHATTYLVDGQFGVLVSVSDEKHALEAVRVKGPGMPEFGGDFQYGSPDAPGQWVGSVPLGTTHPTPPLSYELELWDGAKTRYGTAVATCFLETSPVILAPLAGDVVTSPVTLRWTAVPGDGVRYLVDVVDRQVVEGQTSTALPLTPGEYGAWIEAERVEGNERLCWSRATQGPFTVAACGVGYVQEPRTLAGGLSTVEALPNTPDQVTLGPNPALVDGNTAVSAAIDLGHGQAAAGDTRVRDVGVQLTDPASAVDELHVWIDRPLPPEVASAYSWWAYRSDDNVMWTAVALTAPIWFGTSYPRFEIPIAQTRAKYLKVVTRPLAAGITNDLALAQVLVTEVRAFANEPLPTCAVASTR